MKTCSTCKETKPLDDFHRMSRAADGRQSKCKPCRSIDTRAHYLRSFT